MKPYDVPTSEGPTEGVTIMYLGLEIAGGWITLDVIFLLCWVLAARYLAGGHE